jgi:[Skp1-protein]-hydroxyproline N-acetylglucosaminyltransferase
MAASSAAAAAAGVLSASSNCIAPPAFSATNAASSSSSSSAAPALGHSSSTIFVSIIAYRDSETRHTVDSIYARARHPERVYCGIVWQYHPGEDEHLLFDGWNLDRYPANRIRQIFMKHTEARGPCLARAMAMERLYNAGCKRNNAISGGASKSSEPGEDFYLQIDSHMRFANGWDVEMLNQWHACEDEMAVLTAYPPGYERASTVWPPPNANDAPPMLCASHFDEKDGMLRFVGRLLAPASTTATKAAASSPAPSLSSTRPFSCLYYAAGFTFSSSSLVRRVPYDPTLTNLFFGEETAMLARLWTAGYNMYLPSRNLIWHCWSRAYRPSFRENTVAGMHHEGSEEQERRRSEEERAKRKVQRMLGMPLMGKELTIGPDEDQPDDDDNKYGLGTVRTLAQFQHHIGVDFSTRTLTARARNGGLSPESFQAPPPAAMSAVELAKKKQQMDLVMRLVMQQSTPTGSGVTIGV